MDLISLPPCSRHLDNNMTDSSITDTFHISTAFLATVSIKAVLIDRVGADINNNILMVLKQNGVN